MNSIITVHDLKKTFRIKGATIEAVRGVNLEVFEQEIFGFLGPNGAGKTTTFRMLTTLLPIDSGEAIVAGLNVKTQPKEVRKKIGYVSQQGGADRNATGRENLILQGQLYGMRKVEAITQASRVIALLALEQCIDRFVSTYSGGQQRRLDIAMGIIHGPQVLFLDEPTTSLDPQNRANVWDKIKNLKSEGMSVFITSHYLDEIDFLADRLAIIDQGKIVELGTPKDLKKNLGGDLISIEVNKEQAQKAIQIAQSQPFVKDVLQDGKYISLYVAQGDVSLVNILGLFHQESITINSINMSVPTLDAVFLKKTGHALREESI
jgi:ABC-2 type transport system ATP-binding protein